MSILPRILARVAAAGHLVFSEGDHNANVVVERRSYAAGVPDDLLHLAYRLGGQWYAWQVPCVSVPHPKYLRVPKHPQGTAILCPGQHRGSHRQGLHRGRPGLRATRALPVWRDDDRDATVDPQGPVMQADGINVHDGLYVMGCVGVEGPSNMRAILHLLEPVWPIWGPTVTLTVLDPGQ